MPLDAQAKWYLDQISLSVECKECGTPTEIALDDEINSFIGRCEHCESLVVAVVVS